mgnify:CR=1 FL=1
MCRGVGGGGGRHREGYDGGVEASLRCEVPCEWHSLLPLRLRCCGLDENSLHKPDTD